MKFKDFVDRINFLYKTTLYPDDKDVVIVTDDGGIGGRSCTKIKSVSQGFDWEASRINITVEDILHKGKRTKDIVNEKDFKGINPCAACSVEPPAMKFICPKCEYNEDNC